MQLLIENGANISDRNGKGYQAIHLAAEFGNLSVLQFLIEQGLRSPEGIIFVDSRDGNGNTPLHLSARSAHLKVLTFLLERDSNIDAINDDGFAPIHLAAKFGHASVGRYLAESGADLNIIPGNDELVQQPGTMDIIRNALSFFPTYPKGFESRQIYSFR